MTSVVVTAYDHVYRNLLAEYDGKEQTWVEDIDRSEDDTPGMTRAQRNVLDEFARGAFRLEIADDGSFKLLLPKLRQDPFEGNGGGLSQPLPVPHVVVFNDDGDFSTHGPFPTFDAAMIWIRSDVTRWLASKDDPTSYNIQESEHGSEDEDGDIVWTAMPLQQPGKDT